jgi:hypothetical protein
MRKKLKSLGVLGFLFLLSNFYTIPHLALLFPGASLGVFIASTYFSAAMTAGAVAGPAGWIMFGLIGSWGL